MPPEKITKPEPDFAEAMRELAQQAEDKRLSMDSNGSKSSRGDMLLNMGMMIRPVAVGIESLNRNAKENHALLDKIHNAIAGQPAAAALEAISRQLQRLNTVESALDKLTAAVADRPPETTLSAIVQQLQRLGTIETANQKLFDALHTELKGYKDSFLFDALQKPFIRDLISLFDDLGAQHQRTREHLENTASEDPFLRTLANNLENTLFHLLEIFGRLDVSLAHGAEGERADKKRHRIIGFEPAERPEDDGNIVRSVRPGFLWRDRFVRPEDVIVLRWAGNSAPPLEKQDPAM